MASKQSGRRKKLCRVQLWRCSKQALFISFFLLFPINTFSMNFVKDYFSGWKYDNQEGEEDFPVFDYFSSGEYAKQKRKEKKKSNSPIDENANTPMEASDLSDEDDLVNWADVISSNENTQVRRPVYEKAQSTKGHFPSRERDLLPQELVDSCKENMPPLLQGIHAYLQSPDSKNPETQIPSFHRFLLIGPPGTSKSTTLEAMVQDLGLKKDTIFEASEFLGEFRGQTAINVRTLFEKLKFTKERKMLVINEMHKLVEDHSNTHTDHKVNAHTIWSNLDYFERNNPNLIIASSANSGTDLPPEMKSRLRVQYVYMPLLDGKRWISGLRPAFARRKNIKLANDIKFPKVSKVPSGKQESFASNENTSQGDTEELKNLINNGLSFRDQQLVVDAATIFAYRDGNRSEDGALIINNNHCMQAFDQLLDKNNVLDFDTKKMTDEERQEKYHKESLEQQWNIHDESLRQSTLYHLQSMQVNLDSMKQQRNMHSESMRQSTLHHIQSTKANLKAQSQQKSQKNAAVNVGLSMGDKQKGINAGLNLGGATAPGITKETASEIENEIFTNEQRRIEKEEQERESANVETNTQTRRESLNERRVEQILDGLPFAREGYLNLRGNNRIPVMITNTNGVVGEFQQLKEFEETNED